MMLFCLLLSQFAGATRIKTNQQFTMCENRLGEYKKTFVSRSDIKALLEPQANVRTLFASENPDANVFILISRDWSTRYNLSIDLARSLGLPILIPGSIINTAVRSDISLTTVRHSPPGQINAAAIVENVGAVRSSYWDEGNTFLSYQPFRKKTETFRHNAIAQIVLMQSFFEFQEWKAHPLETLFKNVNAESGANEAVIKLGGEVIRRLAGVYYVGQP